MLGVLVWIVVILLICFSVTGWHWIIFYVVILPFSTLLFFFYVDFPENRFNIKRFKNDIKYLLTYIIHSGFISGYQNRYGDNLKPPTNVYHRMTA